MRRRITFTVDEDRFLPIYRSLLHSGNDIEFVYGSRDSGKSRHIAQQLILKCLQNRKFVCPLIRKVSNTIKDSQWAMIKSICEEWGWDRYFEFTTHPLEIRCIFGGKFLARGMDEPKKIKSLTDPTDAWIEEGTDLDENDWTVITTSLRSNLYKTQIWVSFNPDVPGDYREFWMYKRYFASFYERGILSYTTSVSENLEDGTRVELAYRATHTTYKDNPYCTGQRKAYYEGLSRTSEYDYQVYAKGLWGMRKTGGEFYKLFNYNRNTADAVTYNKDLPLHISFDFNVNPYLTCTVWQITGKKAVQIEEICLSSPRNTTVSVCREFVRLYQGHQAGLFVYGDPSGRQQDTRSEKGFNDYVLILRELAQFRPSLRVDNAAPPVVGRGNFINSIFATGYGGLEIVISRKCIKSINDYSLMKEASDGTKLKEKAVDKKTNVSYEKFGHTSDANDYLLCRAFVQDFVLYQRGGKAVEITMGKRSTKNSY